MSHLIDCYDECRRSSSVLNVVILSVVMLNVVMLYVVILNVDGCLNVSYITYVFRFWKNKVSFKSDPKMFMFF